MSPLSSGVFFSLAAPAQGRTLLVRYKEARAGDEHLWKANTLVKPGIFYRDWYFCETSEEKLSPPPQEPEFLPVLCLNGEMFLCRGTRADLVFSGQEGKQSFRIRISRNGGLLDVFTAECSLFEPYIHSYDFLLPGEYEISCRWGIAEWILSRVHVHEPLRGHQISLTAERKLTPVKLTSEDPDPLRTAEVYEEELYFSLRDALGEEDYRETDFVRLCGKPGPGRFLNTLKFLSRKDEIRLISDLFRKDPSLGLELLSCYFSADLIPGLKPGLIRQIIKELPEPLALIYYQTADEKERTVLLPYFESRLPEKLESGEVHTETFVRAVREAVATFGRACMQSRFGVTVPIGMQKQSVFPSFADSQTNGWIYFYEAGRLLTGSSGSGTDEEWSGGFFFNEWSFPEPLFRINRVTTDFIYLQVLHFCQEIQLVLDDQGLAREDLTRFLNASPGDVIRLPVSADRFRIKAGGSVEAVLYEHVFDCIRAARQSGDIIPMPADHGKLPVAVVRRSSEGQAFFLCSVYGPGLLSSSLTAYPVSGAEKQYQIPLSPESGMCMKLIDEDSVRTVIYPPKSSEISAPLSGSTLPMVRFFSLQYGEEKPDLDPLWQTGLELYASFFPSSAQAQVIARTLDCLGRLDPSGKKKERFDDLLIRLKDLLGCKRLHGLHLLGTALILKNLFFNPVKGNERTLEKIRGLFREWGEQEEGLAGTLTCCICGGEKPGKRLLRKWEQEVIAGKNAVMITAYLHVLIHSSPEKAVRLAKTVLPEGKPFSDLDLYGPLPDLVALLDFLGVQFSLDIRDKILSPEDIDSNGSFPEIKTETSGSRVRFLFRVNENSVLPHFMIIPSEGLYPDQEDAPARIRRFIPERRYFRSGYLSRNREKEKITLLSWDPVKGFPVSCRDFSID